MSFFSQSLSLSSGSSIHLSRLQTLYINLINKPDIGRGRRKKKKNRRMAYRGGESDDGESHPPVGGVSFETFFEGWLVRQNQYLEQLRAAAANSDEKEGVEVEEEKLSDEQLQTLTSRVLYHYQQYYEAKSIASRRDVFILFAPPWFNTYEKTFFWIAGFKPGLALRLINHSVKDLTEEQKQSIKKLTVEIRAKEKELNDEMALIQESLASPQWVDLTRRAGRLIDGESLEVESAFQSLKEAMEGLVVGADFLRITTATKLVDILRPCQAVRFLAAATQLQVRIRNLGSEKEAAAAAQSSPRNIIRRLDGRSRRRE